ncbi:MAG TPA: DUF2442 domain-containing protein [Pyrinomonadaceae bacterium]|jgi:hypothetical protein
MKKVIAATASDDFTLTLEFNDGSIRCFDVKPYLEIGIFRELKDLNYFKNIRLAFGTVQWRNEQDFAPETLYIESIEIEKKELAEV